MSLQGSADSRHAEQARNMIAEASVREALDRLIERARGLGLKPRTHKLGPQLGFRFGPQAYPVCRINRHKGLAFHANRYESPHIIRVAGDRSFEIASGVLRRLALELSLQD